MGDVLIEGRDGLRAAITPLRVIAHDKGEIRHALKASDPSFCEFGEAYFTSVIPGEIKGWKKHTRMQMQIVVPRGDVQFYLRHEDYEECVSVIVGHSNFVRLTIDPGIWVAFEAATEIPNLVLNIASLEHDPAEAIDVPLETYALG